MIKFIITSGLLVVGIIAAYNLSLNFDSQWHWLVLCIIYTVTVNDIFCHRICSHNMFNVDTNTITFKILTWLASVDFAYGPVKNITFTHHLHHKYSDAGPMDVMNWRYHWYSSTAILPFPVSDSRKPKDYTSYTNRQFSRFGNILTDPWVNFCARYQVYIATVTLATLYLISPMLFEMFCLSRLLMTVMTGLAGFCGHVKNFPLSYRNFNTNDTTSNNLVFHYLFLGFFEGLLQNNHHGRPKAVSPNPKWWEFDTSKPVVLLLKCLLEKKDTV